jgi:ABC-2 type transport system permease protein
MPPVSMTAGRRRKGSGVTAHFADILRSEWTKIRSVRSTYWTIVAAVLASVALGALLCANYASRYDRLPLQDRVGFDPTTFSLSGIYLAQLAIGTLGVLAITAEYSTGMIRTTFTAVPQRRAVLSAKAAVFGALALVLGLAMSFAAFGIGQAILHTRGIGASLGDPTVLRAVVGGGLYLAVLGLLGLGLGGLIRRTPGALAALFGVLFATSALVDLLPTSWRNDVIKFMPANAGSQIFTVYPSHDALPPWSGFGVFCLYALVALGVALLLVTRRDA